MKRLVFTQLVVATLAVAVLTIGVAAQEITPTPYFTNFYDDASTYNGELLPVGTILTAYDQSGVLCGIDTVHTLGSYGFMPVYGDDPMSPEDEGADGGETIAFKINGRDATVVSGDGTFTDQDTKQVRLSAGATVAVTAIDMPNSQAATFNDTARFYVGIRNDGEGTDFYGVSALNGNLDFTTLPQDTDFYAEPGDTIYVYFEIETPTWTLDTVDHISFTVYSRIDTTARITGEVDLYFTITDVDDGDDPLLPGGFALHQNYPNPFNPSTTIGFALPARSPVELRVFNALGREVDSRHLGDLPAGEHEIDYDGSLLASGVYFYRIVTDHGSEARKMVLVK